MIFVTDDAKNIKRAISDLSNQKWVERFSYTLYLSLGKAVNVVRVKNKVTRCRKIVNYFSNSNNSTRQFVLWVYESVFLQKKIYIFELLE